MLKESGSREAGAGSEVVLKRGGRLLLTIRKDSGMLHLTLVRVT